MLLSRKLSVDLGQHLAPRVGGILQSPESAPPDATPILDDHAVPSLGLSVPVHADDTGRVVPLHGFVAPVFGFRSQSEIIDPIVRSVPVPVINLSRFPFPVDVEPRQNVSVVVARIRDLYLHIALHVRPSDLAGPFCVPLRWMTGAMLPPKDSGNRIIIQDRSHEFSRQRLSRWLSHVWLTALQFSQLSPVAMCFASRNRRLP